ncbi:hypothetical protein OTK51_18945 [Vibrio scophthalmi]|uniref:hypothetical protein n=1 Tax=Vibrio scophthalmi TaxID=45658 RepID=UPI0022847BB3|nr:hypothetical protein [Vibrio scophthalmi]MCY9805504.1 hypothetical protein [Vibrio scophthalmi]
MAIDNDQGMVGKVIFRSKRNAQRYVVDLKENSRIADTKKAGCGDRLFLCVRLLEQTITPQFVGYNSSGLFVHTQ